MKQRTTEWIELVDDFYHERQFKEPYRSTIAFCDWLEKSRYLNKSIQARILDVGAGQGANIFYMAKKYPECKLVGIDINNSIVKKGNEFFHSKAINNCSLEVGDLYNFSDEYISKFDGIVSIHTLSWLPEYKKPIEAMAKLNPKWIALSALFYDGEVSCTIQMKDFTTPKPGRPFRESFYNIYSLNHIQQLFKELGFSEFNYIPFEIDIDLPRPESKGRGTYTKKLENGHRIQISGPLLQPWYFILASK